MLRVIEKQHYDTLTAELVADFDTGYPCTDIRHHYETLYLSSEGSWFLLEEDGPHSPYAGFVPGGLIGAETIHPLTPEQAQEWLEDHQKVAELGRYFRDMNSAFA